MLEIKLNDPQYCNGCPCLQGSKDFASRVLCANYKEEITHHFQTFPEFKHTGFLNRLETCKQNDASDKINKSVSCEWDDLSYDEKESLRVHRPALWRKLYKAKFGVNS